MTTHQAGIRPASAHRGQPPLTLRQRARRFVLRASVRGFIPWRHAFVLLLWLGGDR